MKTQRYRPKVVAFEVNIPDPKTGQRRDKPYIVCLACAYHSLIINRDYPEYQNIVQVKVEDNRCDKCGVLLTQSFKRRVRKIFFQDMGVLKK